MPTLFVATWSNGVTVFSAGRRCHERAGESVRHMVSDGHGGVLAIVGRHAIERRHPDGGWETIATATSDLSCILRVGAAIYVGTDGDAGLLRMQPSGELERLTGFDSVPGREAWYAGSAVIDGKVVGPPLGVRSLAATCDGRVILANVHVGGIPRSADGGKSWLPTIEVDCDVHEVRAHPSDPNLVIAASAVGLGVSRDAGQTWAIETDGLDGVYCSAVRFAADQILVAASTDHFAPKGAVYRRPIDGAGPLIAAGSGLPRWTGGIVDTGCISSSGTSLAIADKSGHLYRSDDSGGRWSRVADDLPGISNVLLA